VLQFHDFGATATLDRFMTEWHPRARRGRWVPADGGGEREIDMPSIFTKIIDGEIPAPSCGAIRSALRFCRSRR